MVQYFRPGGRYFAGDAMPFFHDGVFHLIYLLDEEHHQALGGLGGHQWAHATTTDLVHWTDHGLAIAITDPGEGSICTGAVFVHQGLYYGFYATRTRERTQHLSLAISDDGIHFVKQQPNPLAMPGVGYSPYHYRDPHVFQDPDSGLFHMLITAKLEPYVVTDGGGCLAHLVSSDLREWRQQEPFLLPGFTDPPECPELFAWNGWYYLVYSNQLVARYLLARHPLGPWQRPARDTLDGRLARVMKSAPFTGNRRIGVAWLGTREGDKDNGRLQWGGHLLFRELIQQGDGTLATGFVPELTPPTAAPLVCAPTVLAGDGAASEAEVTLDGGQGLAVAVLNAIPQEVRITFQCQPQVTVGSYGLRLRGTGNFEGGYDLLFQPVERIVRLHEEAIYAVDGLDQPFAVEIILYEDLFDVCIDGRRCIVNRCPERRGNHLFFFAHQSNVTFSRIQIAPLQAKSA